MLTIYHNPRCSKSRQALKMIQSAGNKPEIIEYLKMPPSVAELRGVLSKLGLSPWDILRKNETVFKEKYKGKELTEDKLLEAMVQNPILIERPIIVKGNKAVLGRPPDNVLNLVRLRWVSPCYL